MPLRRSKTDHGHWQRAETSVARARRRRRCRRCRDHGAAARPRRSRGERRARPSKRRSVALTRRPVHCVVLDLTVAGSGGNLKVLDAIRTNPDDRVAGARVVLCSPGGTNRLFAWESGVDGFLSTPFHVDSAARRGPGGRRTTGDRAQAAPPHRARPRARRRPPRSHQGPRRRPLRPAPRRLSARSPIRTAAAQALGWRPRGCSSAAEHQLPKLRTRVRFPSPAPMRHARSTSARIGFT